MRRLSLPRYEYSLRELSTGASFFAYADHNNSTNASLFADYVIEHPKSYGITTDKIWQTDNGSAQTGKRLLEFIGNVKKKINRLSAFQSELKDNQKEHGRIPPRSPHLQGDVETFHPIIEDELFEVESYANPIEFLGKSYAYQLYFNYLRRNRYRENKSPVEILKKRFPQVDIGVLNLPPIRLEQTLTRLGEIWFPFYYNGKHKTRRSSTLQGGYHVPIPVQEI